MHLLNFVANQVSLCFGARSRNRTGMEGMLPRDFKSLASTNFAIRAMMGRNELEAGVGIEPA
jgi:hypothetical protein